jgi:ATP-dependent Lhr-like helicase
VVLVDGVATLYVERGGRTLQTLPAFDGPEVAEAAIPALRRLIGEGRDRELVVTKVDGLPVGQSPARDALVRHGFVAGYRGLVLRDR